MPLNILCLNCTSNVDITKLRDTILGRVKAGPQEIDMLQWFGRTALELIGQSGLGKHLYYRVLSHTCLIVRNTDRV